MVARACLAVVGLCSFAAPAGAYPVASFVLVHSRGDTHRAVTSHLEWMTRGSEFGQILDLDYAALPVVGLSIRGGERVVIRLHQAARSVAVKLGRGDGRVVRRRARALAPAGTVWRVRLPGGIRAMRLMLIGVRYRPVGRIVMKGAVVYEKAVCATVFCAPVYAIA